MCLPEPGCSRLRFIHLVEKVPPINILMKGVDIVKSLPYTEYKNYTLSLGEPFYHISVTSVSAVNEDIKQLLKSLIAAFRNQTIHTFVLTGTINDLSLLHIPDQNELNTDLAKNFNSSYYMGTWHVIANIPQILEKSINCSNQSNIYTDLNVGMKVKGTCYDKNFSPTMRITGKAFVPNINCPAAIRMEFTGQDGVDRNSINIEKIQKGPNYLVHCVDYDKYALVGTPYMDNLIVLARDRKIPKRLIESHC